MNQSKHQNRQKPSGKLQPKWHPVTTGEVDGYSPKRKGRARKRRQGGMLPVSPPCLVIYHRQELVLRQLFDGELVAAPEHGYRCGNGLWSIDRLRSMGFHIEGGYDKVDGHERYVYWLTPAGHKQAKVALEYRLWLDSQNKETCHGR